MRRAFSLVEAMVVVAIIASLAALASPNIIDVVWAQRLEGAAESCAAAVAAARLEAMTSKRCARVVLGERELHVERLNVFDCDEPTRDPPPARIARDAPLWVRVRSFAVDAPLLVRPGVPWLDRFPDGDAAPQLRFRPSGRLFSQDDAADFRTEGAVLIVRHPTLSNERGTKRVGVQRNGLECVMPRGAQVPLHGDGSVRCP